jgi:hypothetical protein
LSLTFCIWTLVKQCKQQPKDRIEQLGKTRNFNFKLRIKKQQLNKTKKSEQKVLPLPLIFCP